MPIEPQSNSAVIDKPKGNHSADDVFELLNDDKETQEIEEKPIKEVREPKEEDEEEGLKLSEDEEEEKLDLSVDEDNLEIDAPPRKKAILKDFPELFKKYPFLEKMMYRDKQYSELFGSFDDAKEIAERAESFNELESQLLSGNTEQILREIKDTDSKAFDLIVDDYLQSLAKVDKDAYWHVTGNLNKRLIMEMWEEANSSGNEDLKQAALLVNQFVFGTNKFTAPSRRVQKNEEADKAKDEIEQERLSFVRERYESSRDEMQTRVDNKLRATIADYIDPRGSMSDYVKKNAVKDAMTYLGETLSNDESISNNLKKLWRDAFDSKFSRDSLSRIESFYLGRARMALKSAILRARAEALKDNPLRHRDRSDDENEEVEETPRIPRKIATGKPSQSKGKNDGPKKGESVTDFFMRD